MADTIKDKLSSAAKSAVDSAKNYVGQAKALFTPIDKATLQSIGSKSDNVVEYKKVNPSPTPAAQAKPNSYKKGGKVKKSGVAKVHKGERVLTTKQTKAFDKKGGLSKLYGK